MSVKNVFISHVHEDDSRLDDLKKLLDKHGCEIRDGSINSLKPNQAKNIEYIRQKILGPRIEWAGAMFVLVSPSTHESEHVEWEIERAHREDKPIIGVWDIGAVGSELPDNLLKYGHVMCHWDGKAIIDALEGKNNEWKNPDGTPASKHDISRYGCS